MSTSSEFSRFDVTIAGAGPAGSILAFLLAGQGIKVLLLEKARLPRAKTCAGGITVRAGALMPFDFQECVENVIYGVRLSYHSAPQRVRRYHLPLAYMVMREKFDYFLALKAREAGARLIDGVNVIGLRQNTDHVHVSTGSGYFSTPLLIGADGANSAVVRSLGLRSGFDYGLGLNACLPAGPDRLKEWDGLIGLDWGIKGGYSWVFPKKGLICAGAASSLREAKKLKVFALNLIRAYKLGGENALPVRGHFLPVRRPHTPLCKGRVLLVGDAGGLVDPLTGEGIFYSLKSSYMAAGTIKKFLLGQTGDLEEYQAAIEKDLVPELKIARTIQKMNSVTPWLFYSLLKNNDRVFSAFCRMLRGEKTYAGIKHSLIPPLRLLFRII